MAGARPPRQVRAPIIADAGPLIALAKVGRLWLMKRLFTRVFTTVEVVAELGLTDQAAGAAAIVQAFDTGWLATLAQHPLDVAHPFLDAGEASCIAAAGRHGAALLVIDERLGRREARRLGIALTGTAGLLCAAKSRGLIKAVVPALEEMRSAGYFLGNNVIEAARIEADE